MSEKKQSHKAVARDQRRTEATLTKAAAKAAEETGKTGLQALASDSFVNFAQMMGVGADNPMSTASYGFNPVTRIRTILEWIHRGSWLGGVAIDLFADDMTRAGVRITGEIDQKDAEKIAACAIRCRVWESINNTYKWARLYGGALAVIMVKGQNLATPLRIESVGRDDFKGLLVLDRWMVEPDLSDTITEPGPYIGLPKFYITRNDAMGLRNQRIHYTRCLRLVGIELPYWQAVMEQMWGISVLERLWDRMTAYDSGTTGIAQLIYKAYIRTYKIEGLRNVLAAGGEPLKGLIAQINFMRKTSSQEGIVVMDGSDEFEAMQNVPFSGLDDALMQLAQQVAGALQMPLTRLLGQSPGGLNSPGDHEMRMYYDNIKKEQNKSRVEVTNIYKVMARSEGVVVKDDFEVEFNSLWQMTDKEKAEIAESDERTIGAAFSEGLIDRQTALKELHASSNVTGRFASITAEQIAEAEDEPLPTGAGAAELELGGQKELETHKGDETRKTAKQAAALAQQAEAKEKKNSARDAATSAPDPEYKRLHDLDGVIENRKGSIRRGVGKNGETWEAMLAADYGYFRRTTGDDGDPVDAFFGPKPESVYVLVISQVDPDTREPDEDKIMVGFENRSQAMAAYLASYTDDAKRRVGMALSTTIDGLKRYLADRPAR